MTAPATAPLGAAAPDAAASAPTQRVEVTGGRGSDEEQRRRSTAAKIVIGREEIEAFGDSTVGEVLRRLPGVTTPGRPGRGGAPRLRGLGSGYTQLLIDGEPIPRGFSLESLTPEQVERIEILRAPTAETGARAIAGTINIVLREGWRVRLNDFKPGLTVEHGRVSPGVGWTHNDSAGALAYNLSGSVFERHGDDRSVVTTRTESIDDGHVLEEAVERRFSDSRRRGVNASARLQWRLGEAGDQLQLSPSLFHIEGESQSRYRLDSTIGGAPYAAADSQGGNRFSTARLNGQWRQRLGPGRAEVGGTASQWRSVTRSVRREADAAGAPLRVIESHARTGERSVQLNGKWSLLLGGSGDRPGSEHSLVTGGELQAVRRDETRTLLQDGLPQLTDFGDNLSASSTRTALYAQNEWNPSAQWSAHAGLRWEAIETTGDLGDGTHPRNRAAVWTPLLHAVWKPDPKSRSQLRMSLTRSWRAPPLNQLIARPSPTTRFPLDGPNQPTFPDRAGNPDLRPELATGVDLAWEHYPSGGGILSASVFHRRIQDLMRRVTTLETVPWSPVPRWVERTRNVGDATTSGVELEAKGRLDQWWAGSPRIELRSNLSLYHSAVDAVPGPDNRLDQQAAASANFGGDWRVPGWPLKIGGNFNWVPGYATQVDADQRLQVSSKRIVDVYALWTFSPAVALRLQAGNLLARDSVDDDTLVVGGVRQSTRTVAPSDVRWQATLELKL
ncbi:MAG: TonB-dependent receptor [Rubrivivax sp.]